MYKHVYVCASRHMYTRVLVYTQHICTFLQNIGTFLQTYKYAPISSNDCIRDIEICGHIFEHTHTILHITYAFNFLFL